MSRRVDRAMGAFSELLQKVNGPGQLLNLKKAGYMSPQDSSFTGQGFACGRCFPAHIRVLTPIGPRAISKLSSGNPVIGYANGRLQQTQIVKTGNRTVSSRDDLIRLRFGTYRKNSIVSTLDHPFYEAKKQEWTKASDLHIGDELFFLPKGQVLSLYMTINNPMKQPEVVIRVKHTQTLMRANGSFPARHYSEEARLVLSKRMKENNPMKNPAIAMKTWANRTTLPKPSKPERFVMSIVSENNLPIWYCGDGRIFWIGYINPDFKVHGQKKVIEVWQRRFPFHRDDVWAEKRRRMWESRGYKCLMLEIKRMRVSQIASERERVAEALQSFVSNGLPIIAIEKPKYPLSPEIQVYNIETETSNYFVKNSTYTPWILVHNCEWVRAPFALQMGRETGFCSHPEINANVELSGCSNKFTYKGVKTE